jgi:hypothetical protein
MPQEVRMAVEQSGAEQSGAEESGAEESGAEQSPGEAAPEAAAGPHGQAAKPDLEETKRKFREALERKRRTHASAEGTDHTGKVHGAQGPAFSRRAFRRKSGG